MTTSFFRFFKSLVILLLAASLLLPGCRTREKVPKQVRQAEKEQAAEEKQAEIEYKNAVKQHYANQSPQTKKEMKEMRKRNKKLNKVHKRSLWDRLFRPGCKTGK